MAVRIATFNVENLLARFRFRADVDPAQAVPKPSSSSPDGSADIVGRMALDLFAGIPVRDYEAARRWYERLLGGEPSFVPHATEAVWELAEHRYLFIEEDGERAGAAIHTLFFDDLDARVADIASRGIQPDERVTYPGKARKAIYRDPDGNEISFGGAIESSGSQ